MAEGGLIHVDTTGRLRDGTAAGTSVQHLAGLDRPPHRVLVLAPTGRRVIALGLLAVVYVVLLYGLRPYPPYFMPPTY